MGYISITKKYKKEELQTFFDKYKSLFKSIVSNDTIILLGIDHEELMVFCDHELVASNYHGKMYRNRSGTRKFKNIDIDKKLKSSNWKDTSLDWIETNGLMNLCELELRKLGYQNITQIYLNHDDISYEDFDLFFSFWITLWTYKYDDYLKALLNDNKYNFSITYDEDFLNLPLEILKKEGF